MRKLFVALLTAWLLPVAALAADLGPPIVNWGGENEKPGPVQQVGYDSSSGLPCIVGKTATCSPPAAALPTGAATAALQTSVGATAHTDSGTINLTLGSPFQAGGSIGNASFGISGTLPAFAATPTFNCGTGCYPATQPVSLASAPLPTNPASIYSAQQTVTTSAVALAAQALSNGLVITADPTNSAIIYIGASGETTTTGYKLQPGASISYGVTNASAVYILSAASTTDKISVTGN